MQLPRGHTVTWTPGPVDSAAGTRKLSSQGAYLNEVGHTWQLLHERVHTQVTFRRHPAMEGAIDTQQVRLLRDRFTRVSEYFSQYHEELRTDTDPMQTVVTADQRQQQAQQRPVQTSASSSTDAAATTTSSP